MNKANAFWADINDTYFLKPNTKKIKKYSYNI